MHIAGLVFCGVDFRRGATATPENLCVDVESKYSLGFRKKPTDHWYNPMRLKTENEDAIPSNSKENCFGNQPKLEKLNNYLRSVRDQIENRYRPKLMENQYRDRREGWRAQKNLAADVCK